MKMCKRGMVYLTRLTPEMLERRLAGDARPRPIHLREPDKPGETIHSDMTGSGEEMQKPLEWARGRHHDVRGGSLIRGRSGSWRR